jgi:Zn finger protein HypA/HybF involved in hydrogenase expression
MKHIYKCQHISFEVYGNEQEVYCRRCKSFIFSIEETEKLELRIAKGFTKCSCNGYKILKEVTTNA